MCEVIIAKNAGFCPGVKTATDRLERAIAMKRAGERVYTLGHLIHNEEYNAGLAARGVLACTVEDVERLAAEATDKFVGKLEELGFLA